MSHSLLALISMLLPWPIRRWILCRFCGYQIHPSARIGLSWVAPVELIMEADSRIGGFTVVKSLQRLEMGRGAMIGRGNWITGYPLNGTSFRHQPLRRSELILQDQSAITHRHIIDCTGGVVIGEFTTIAGYHSQILTHSIDLVENRQSSSAVEIGHHCFIGTNCVILGGSRLPDCSVLGAKALLNHVFTSTHQLYAGVPAVPVKGLSPELPYFHRRQGVVE